MDATFRLAIVISAIAHSVIFIPIFTPASESVKRPDKPLAVDYVRIKEPEPVKVFRAAVAAETPKVEVAKIVIAKDAAAPKPAVSRPSSDAVARQEARELARRQAPLRKTKDYINYYQLIREKIRRELKARYMKSYGEGDVSVLFMLNSDGTLASVEADQARSVPDGNLIQIASQSVKDANPFPSFPKELSVARMSFDLTISFKRE